MCWAAPQVTWCSHALQLLIHQDSTQNVVPVEWAEVIKSHCSESWGVSAGGARSQRKVLRMWVVHDTHKQTPFCKRGSHTSPFNIFSAEVLRVTLLKLLYRLSLFPFGPGQFLATTHSSQNSLPFVTWVNNSEWLWPGYFCSNLSLLWLSGLAHTRNFFCLGDLPI